MVELLEALALRARCEYISDLKSNYKTSLNKSDLYALKDSFSQKQWGDVVRYLNDGEFRCDKEAFERLLELIEEK